MKIALVENFGSDFYGARLRYALFLQKLGHEVIAIVPNDGYTEKIRNAGINTIAIDIDIRERSLSAMLKFGQKLGKIFNEEVKPKFVENILEKLCSFSCFVNSFSTITKDSNLSESFKAFVIELK